MIRLSVEQAIKCLEEDIQYLRVYEPKIDFIDMSHMSVHTTRIDHTGDGIEKKDEDDLVLVNFIKKNTELNIRFKDRVL